jgi:hypothetical protein
VPEGTEKIKTRIKMTYIYIYIYISSEVIGYSLQNAGKSGFCSVVT